MAILDQTLNEMTEQVRSLFPIHPGAERVRGGLARGIAWAEVSARLPDGSWGELRIHHRPNERRLQAGLLCYQSLAQGGRTIVIGEESLHYYVDPKEVSAQMAQSIERWIGTLAKVGT